MNELQIFNNPEFGEIRTITEDGKTLFCGKDVTTALGYKDSTNAIKQHCRGVVKRHLTDHCKGGLTKRYPIIDTLGRPQEGIYFWTTREGLDWLGRKLQLQIHDPKD